MLRQYQEAGKAFELVEPGFAYNSGTNSDFLGVEKLRELIRKHVDPAFQPV